MFLTTNLDYLKLPEVGSFWGDAPAFGGVNRISKTQNLDTLGRSSTSGNNFTRKRIYIRPFGRFTGTGGPKGFLYTGNFLMITSWGAQPSVGGWGIQFIKDNVSGYNWYRETTTAVSGGVATQPKTLKRVDWALLPSFVISRTTFPNPKVSESPKLFSYRPDVRSKVKKGYYLLLKNEYQYIGSSIT